jgi:hypothetical protein
MRFLAILMLLVLATVCFALAYTRKPIVYKFAKNPWEIAAAAKWARAARFLLGLFLLHKKARISPKYPAKPPKLASSRAPDGGGDSLCPNCVCTMHFCPFCPLWHNVESVTYTRCVPLKRASILLSS